MATVLEILRMAHIVFAHSKLSFWSKKKTQSPLPLLFKIVVLLVSQFPSLWNLDCSAALLHTTATAFGTWSPNPPFLSGAQLRNNWIPKRIPNGHQKDTKKGHIWPHRSSRSGEACQDPLECGTELGADISTNVI